MVLVWNNPINLTRKEYDILLYLISNKNRVVSKITLAEYIWGDNSSELDSFDTLFAHIKNLRKKLKSAKAEVDFKSIYGVGYQIVEL
jgi:DNA-binding response OmpR family regulator